MNPFDRIVISFATLLVVGLAVRLWTRSGSSLSTEKVRKKQLSTVERGNTVFERQGCNACHSIDGTRNTGPTMENLYQSERTIKEGMTVEVDREYLRESIRYPGRKVVQGYPDNMPSYEHLSDEQVQQLVTFIISRSEKLDEVREDGSG